MIKERSYLPVVDVVATGKNINRLIKENKLTKRELQYILGFSTPQAIYKWCRGDCLPLVDNLVILSAVFDVPMDDIIVLK